MLVGGDGESGAIRELPVSDDVLCLALAATLVVAGFLGGAGVAAGWVAEWEQPVVTVHDRARGSMIGRVDAGK